MRHHTKDKGDSGVGFIVADLLKNGIQVATLISEHLPFDLIAISEDMMLCRLSVKYRRSNEGIIKVSLRSSWSDKKGIHFKKADQNLFDATAIYCPDTDKCYYIKNDEIDETITLRIQHSRQVKNVKFAVNFVDPNRLFGYENPFF